ncbi:MAG: DNA-binding response regulator [Bacteroidetes bacterium CG18_big_fil_WC_8_21_14_2_50_41_14]|nr:MAG: DNA-binding response regulator [Bacteroidetes bacterium CG18_big_fil_WC_8_21_14_2_50_41_14]
MLLLKVLRIKEQKPGWLYPFNFNMMDIQIAVIDDHDLFREGLTLVLNQVQGFQVVYDTSDGFRFLEMLDQVPIDIALMDIEMPGINGIEITEKVLSLKPDLKVIALSMFSDTGHYTQMIHAGAKGFVLKKANKFELEQAIRAVHQGGNYFSQDILQKMAFRYTNHTVGCDQLTSREIGVIALVCQGLTSQEISERLYISVKTVETHRSNIFLKAGVKNIAGLIMWAIKNQYYNI